MTKHIHEIGRENAIKTMNKVFPTDYIKDEKSSDRAGYDVFRSTAEGYNDYICDLGDRFEINLSNGDTVNIWIDNEPEPAADAEPENEMHEYNLTVGLFDKDTEKQEISTDAAKRIISEILLNKFNIYAFTMIDCYGVYKMESTGRIVREPSIRIEIATDEAMTESIEKIIDIIKSPECLNQESIMMKHSIEKISFR